MRLPPAATFGRNVRIGLEAILKKYELKSVTGGRDAIGEVHLEITTSGQSYRGTGRSTDVIEASVLAYLTAINRAIIGITKPTRVTTKDAV